jgi:hypothetical protein
MALAHHRNVLMRESYRQWTEFIDPDNFGKLLKRNSRPGGWPGRLLRECYDAMFLLATMPLVRTAAVIGM